MTLDDKINCAELLAKADLEILIEPGYRLELLAGQLVWERPADVAHQRCSRRLQRILETYFWQIDPRGEIFSSPLGISLDGSFLLPDLVYISGEQRELILETHIAGAPNLVAEIISPFTRERDCGVKFNLYQKAGVQHYWLLDHEEQMLQCFALRNGGYTLAALGVAEDIVEHPDFAGLALPLVSLWGVGDGSFPSRY